jgi:hypothetical protein
MSIRVMANVWDMANLGPYERLVMLCLADHADDDGKCYPAIKRICERTGMGQRGVQNVLRRLEADGLLTIQNGGGRHVRNGYTLTINTAPDAPLRDEKPRTENPVSGAETPHPITETPHPITINPAPDAPEPSVTIKEPSVSKTREALLTVLRPETADAFIAHRQAKRSKMTDHAAGLIAKSLQGHPDPDAVVNHSIMNGWTGVFPDSFKSNSQQKAKPNGWTDTWRGILSDARMADGADCDPAFPLLPPGR